MSKVVPLRPADGPDEVMVEAARWHFRLAQPEVSAVERAAFEAWREQSVANALAYADVEATWRLARAAAGEPPMLAVRQETLARLVLPRSDRRASRRAVLGAVAAGSAAAMVPLAWLGRHERVHGSAPPPAPAEADVRTYASGVGERLTVQLPDGSSAVLNTASRLRTAYSKAERRVVLESGEALFEVAKGQPRPFRVTAHDRTITAHGTVFNVRVAAATVAVALLEGAVSVRGRDASGEVQLKPNDVLIADGATTSVRAVADAAALASWRDGLVLFDDSTLADAAAEMNRYVERPRLEVSPEIARLRVSGAFRIGQTEAFVAALQQGFSVAVRSRSEDRIELGAKAS